MGKKSVHIALIVMFVILIVGTDAFYQASRPFRGIANKLLTTYGPTGAVIITATFAMVVVTAYRAAGR